MKTQIQLVPNEQGGKNVIVHGKFNVGHMYEEEPNKIVLTQSVSIVKGALRRVLSQHVPSSMAEDWETTLNEYVKLCVLDLVGMSSFPPAMKDGEVTGFKDGCEVIKESVCLD